MPSPPVGLRGVSIGTTTSWPGRLFDGRRDLAERAAVDVGSVGVEEAALDELAGDERDAARLVDVRGDEAATGLEAGDDGRARRDPVEVVDRERDAELVRDGEQVEDAVRGPAGRGDRTRSRSRAPRA